MAGMFGLLKELKESRTLEKVLVREEARHPITKHVNSISLIRIKEEKSVGINEVVVKNVKPNKSDIAEPLEKDDRKDEVEDRTNDEQVRSIERDFTGEKVRELVETPRQCEAYHSLLIEHMCKAMLKKLITNKEDMGEWEERIKFHQEKELEFNQWRGKFFNDKNSATKREDVTLEGEGGVT
ncbi:hypothetical protein Tco_1075466 [Tanacetum coccineum]